MPVTERRLTNKVMHTKRYKKLTVGLCETAVEKCFKGKWRRNDVLTFIEKYAGIPCIDIKIDDLSGSRKYKNEAVKAIGLMLYGTIEDLIEYGIEPDDMSPVVIRQRPDGMTGKIRDIALLCILHQLLGHVEELMIEPLLKARLLPTQHASIPRRGQTALKNQAHRFLLKKALGITHFRKIDDIHAYATLKYQVCVQLIKEEIPKARYAIGLLEYLGKIAPGGHLIIGGYLDAWLFNFAKSYAVRYLYTLGSIRRGKRTPYVIRCGTFMDDVAIMSSSVKGQVRAVKAIGRWLKREQQIEIKQTTGVIKLLSIEEEKRRRNLPKKAQRGVPMLDMAGFRMSRTHVTIRRRVFKKTRRQLLRGYRELKATGTLRRIRAQKLISYNSYIEQTDSFHLKEKYHVNELMEAANKINSFCGYLKHKKRMEELNVLRERRRGTRAAKGRNRNITGQKNRPNGGRRGRVQAGRSG